MTEKIEVERDKLREALEEMLPRYIELFEAAGLGDHNESIAVKLAHIALGSGKAPGEYALHDIHWYEDLDDYDNSIWRGSSPFCVDGDPFMWRLKQLLCGNKIVWYADHDAELVDGAADQTWATIEEAKASCQHKHNEIIESEQPVAT